MSTITANRPSHSLMQKARHYDTDAATSLVDAVDRATANDEPLDTDEIANLMVWFVNELVSEGHICLTDRSSYLEWEEYVVEVDIEEDIVDVDDDY